MNYIEDRIQRSFTEIVIERHMYRRSLAVSGSVLV